MSDTEITGPFHVCETIDGGDSEEWLAHATTKHGAILACVELFRRREDAQLRILGEDYDRVATFFSVTSTIVNAARADELQERMRQLDAGIASCRIQLDAMIRGSGFMSDAAYADALERAQHHVDQLAQKFTYTPLSLYQITAYGKAWIEAKSAGVGENDEAL